MAATIRRALSPANGAEVAAPIAADPRLCRGWEPPAAPGRAPRPPPLPSAAGAPALPRGPGAAVGGGQPSAGDTLGAPPAASAAAGGHARAVAFAVAGQG